MQARGASVLIAVAVLLVFTEAAASVRLPGRRRGANHDRSALLRRSRPCRDRPCRDRLVASAHHRIFSPAISVSLKRG